MIKVRSKAIFLLIVLKTVFYFMPYSQADQETTDSPLFFGDNLNCSIKPNGRMVYADEVSHLKEGSPVHAKIAELLVSYGLTQMFEGDTQPSKVLAIAPEEGSHARAAIACEYHKVIRMGEVRSHEELHRDCTDTIQIATDAAKIEGVYLIGALCTTGGTLE